MREDEEVSVGAVLDAAVYLVVMAAGIGLVAGMAWGILDLLLRGFS